jgi:hypothetical protein
LAASTLCCCAVVIDGLAGALDAGVAGADIVLVGTAVDVLTGMDELADADAAGVFELLCDPTAPMMPRMTARPMRTRQPMPVLLLFKVVPFKVGYSRM